MAIVRAVKSGNWSDTTVWNTGALPTSADDVYSNTFTVTIDVSPTVLSISNAAATGVTAGGVFVITSNGITLSSNVIAASGLCLNVNIASGSSATIIGNVSSLSGGNQHFGAQNSSSGTLNIIGNVTGGLGGSPTYGVNNNLNGIVNITGQCTGGSTGSGSHGAGNSAGGTINITGSCVGGNSSNGVANLSSGTVSITGSCLGGSSALGYGAQNNSSGIMTHVGTATASAASAAIGLGSAAQITTLTGPLISSDGSGGTAAASGVNPCVALRWFPADTALGTFEYRMRGQTVSGSPSVRPARQLFLTNAYDATYPVAGNVRGATTYGPGNIYTGTCAVPPAGSVALGVPVDNTTGTAAITAANIRSAVGLASANLDAQLAAIPTTAAPSASSIAAAVWSAVTRTITGGTVDTLTNAPDVPTEAEIATAVRTELSTELGRIDANTSSRLAAVAYTAPPSVGDIAAAVWAAATRTLTTAFDSSTTIAAAVWSAATRTLTSSSAPSAADNAAAVWGYSSGRTVTGGTVDTVTNSTPVDAGEIADAVRTELTPELARLSNAATTQEVGDIVEEALQ